MHELVQISRLLLAKQICFANILAFGKIEWQRFF